MDLITHSLRVRLENIKADLDCLHSVTIDLKELKIGNIYSVSYSYGDTTDPIHAHPTHTHTTSNHRHTIPGYQQRSAPTTYLKYKYRLRFVSKTPSADLAGDGYTFEPVDGTYGDIILKEHDFGNKWLIEDLY